MSTSASGRVTPSSDNTTLMGADEVNCSLAKEWKRCKLPWREKPVPVPPPPQMDPVGERIQRELQRRKGSRREVSRIPGLEVPMAMSKRINRNQHTQRSDAKEVGPTRRVNNEEAGPSRRSHWYMPQLQWNKAYWNEVDDKTVSDKAKSMAKETLYLTQERIRLLDEYVAELQHKSGSPALFNIGYTIRKMRGILDDCYIIYTVLYRHKFEKPYWEHNVATSIYYYTYCFKNYIDIIYYVEAVMVAYADVKKDKY